MLMVKGWAVTLQSTIVMPYLGDIYDEEYAADALANAKRQRKQQKRF